MIMKNLEQKIIKTRQFLTQALFFLREFKEKREPGSLNNAKEMVKKVELLKRELLKDYEIEDLKNFDPILTNIAKQISDTFDNIIRDKNLEMSIVAKKLKLLQNQKKILNYSR